MRLLLEAALTPIAEQQRRYARAVPTALNKTALDVREAIVNAMRQEFDRPTPFTLRAFRIANATAANPVATVYAMPMQARYLLWQIEGGDRNSKGFEKRLQLFGGEAAIPVAGAKLNAYGNMSLAFIRRATASGDKRFFTGTPRNHDGSGDGVWMRKAGGLVQVMKFQPDARYKQRLDMEGVAARTVGQRFQFQLMKALAR